MSPWSDRIFFFFFQAEDGIRVLYMTGVQTCALPIFRDARPQVCPEQEGPEGAGGRQGREIGRASCRERVYISVVAVSLKKKIEQELSLLEFRENTQGGRQDSTESTRRQ